MRSLPALYSVALLGLASLAAAGQAPGLPALLQVEQDGRQLLPVSDAVRVERSPFTFVIAIPAGTEIQAHASTSAAAYEAARAGRPLAPFFVDGGSLAIDLLNSSRVLYLATDDQPAHHAWFYEGPDDHTFDSVSMQGATRLARYTVAVLGARGTGNYTLARFPGAELFVTVRVIGNANRKELRRAAVRITLAEPGTSPAQVEKEEAAIRLPAGAPAPKKVRHVEAVYPDRARSARIQGTVEIEATIGPDGTVRTATLVRSIPLLDAAALDAVKQWRYEPVVVDGVPRTVRMTVSVTFSLH